MSSTVGRVQGCSEPAVETASCSGGQRERQTEQRKQVLRVEK